MNVILGHGAPKHVPLAKSEDTTVESRLAQLKVLQSAETRTGERDSLRDRGETKHEERMGVKER